METLDHLATVRELADIVRGEHPGWEGDRRCNGGAFLRRIRNDMPEAAAALAADIGRNLMDFATETGISPRTLELTRRVLVNESSDI